MEKPSWGAAPDWANWRAWDEDGDLIYFEKEPIIDNIHYGWFEKFGRATICFQGLLVGGCPDWRTTLEKRPDRKGERWKYVSWQKRLLKRLCKKVTS